MEITEKIRSLIEPLVLENQGSILDITYKREGGSLILRVVVDKEGGITMGECAELNKKLSDILDKENIIDEEYTIEISSPGLDRKLTKDSDFIWAVGKEVKITTYAPLEGKNVFLGKLMGLGDKTVVISEEGISLDIPREKVASARLNLNIDWSKK